MVAVPGQVTLVIQGYDDLEILESLEPGGPSRPSKVGAPRPEMHPSPPEADGGLRGPPDDADGGGKDGGQAQTQTF